MDPAAILDLALKGLTDPSGGIQAARDVYALVGAYQAAKSGKIQLASLSQAQAIAFLQEINRVSTVALHLLQDQNEGQTNFDEMRSLMGSL